jgi:phenylpropionate dioxygenase-like ring-hydroxylating dioxygenase large terminal subunit
MLTQEENEFLSRVGPGTPMGELLRRFWLPVLLAEELPEPDCAPVRVRILCENLVAFKNTDGEIGLLAENCPHRRASLFWGRNEESGLRCTYHGWKFDIEGNCVDMPSEPAEYEFKRRVKATAYPAVERGGAIWAYMGPKELKPELPELEWARLPNNQRAISKQYQINNWAQAVEGGIDSSHVSFLHRAFEFGQPNKPVRANNNGATEPQFMVKDTGPRFTVKKTDYGLLIGARREIGDDNYYWRISQFLAPFYTMIPGAVREDVRGLGGHAWVPSDDYNTWTFTVQWNPDRPFTEQEIAAQHAPAGLYATIDEKYRPIRNAENDYLIDRYKQKTESYTGILGGREQDRSIQESMGIIVERDLEHLGTSDTAIIAFRRLLINLARDLQKGKEPFAANHGDAYKVRSTSVVSSEPAAFDEAAKERLVSRL